MSEKSKSNEIRIVRVYDAPLATVWDAWTDPEQLAQWWGPRGFTITTHSKDLRSGGHWKYTMHGPDGTDWPNNTKYHEVKTHSKLVYDHGGNGTQPPLFKVTVLFSESDGKTTMDMTMALPTPEAMVETRKRIKMHNGNSTWDRLAEYLEKESKDKEIFVINRSFDVPVETMFEIWTDPKHVEQWMPPTGFTMKFIRVDMHAGGSGFYVMNGPNNMKMYGRTEYHEIKRPSRIVYSQQFCDEHEKITRHPMSPTWPETMLTTVSFVAEGADHTRVTIQWEPTGKTTTEEIATFVQGRAGMTQGWTGSLDKLESYLEKR